MPGSKHETQKNVIRLTEFEAAIGRWKLRSSKDLFEKTFAVSAVFYQFSSLPVMRACLEILSKNLF